MSPGAYAQESRLHRLGCSSQGKWPQPRQGELFWVKSWLPERVGSSSRSRRGPFGSGRPRSASPASPRSPIVRWPVLSGSRLSHGRGGALGSACLTSSHWRRIAADPQHEVRGLPRQLDDLVLRQAGHGRHCDRPGEASSWGSTSVLAGRSLDWVSSVTVADSSSDAGRV